ncbi:MAG: AtpZ/AtpI family protein [Anaerolineae bacterium]|nr:AtpZ/AtpI family protein [Anaerolineae bacterium]
MADKPDDDRFWGALWRESLIALSLGWELALPIFAGVLLGQLLDQWLGTLPTFTLGLLTLGIGLGYYNLLRFIRRIDRRDHQAQEAAKREREP